jgi:LysM domain
MSAVSAIESAVFDEVEVPASGRGAGGQAAARPVSAGGHLQLVAASGVPAPGVAARGVAGRGSAATRIAAPGLAAPGLAAPGVAAPGFAGPGFAAPGVAAPGFAAPLRLTRRGRLVVGVLAAILAAVVITLVGMAAPGGAQAANHGRAGAGYQGMRQIVVQPGQTLWSIASRAEPSADPRLVISQIMAANSMTSSAIVAGELLWVPK